ncbi:MAG: hypothetical protein V4465_03285 [Patescibacteria group bacterium]
MKTTHKIHYSLERGSGTTATVALGILILFAILGGALYRSDYGNDDLPKNITYGTPSYTDDEPQVVSTTIEVPTGETTRVYQPGGTTVVRKAISAFPGGSSYHSAFGLTVSLPPGWSNTPSVGSDVYAGVPDTASIHFAGPAGQNMTINVFTKEQWNNIRIQETLGQVNAFGEGSYLGENFTYIYSVQGTASDLQNIASRVVFY